MSTPGNKLPEDGLGTLTTLTVAVIFTGLAVPIVGGRFGRCSGSTRSMRLQFEQQRIEIQKAADAENAHAAEQNDAQP